MWHSTRCTACVQEIVRVFSRVVTVDIKNEGHFFYSDKKQNVMYSRYRQWERSVNATIYRGSLLAMTYMFVQLRTCITLVHCTCTNVPSVPYVYNKNP